MVGALAPTLVATFVVGAANTVCLVLSANLVKDAATSATLRSKASNLLLKSSVFIALTLVTKLSAI